MILRELFRTWGQPTRTSLKRVESDFEKMLRLRAEAQQLETARRMAQSAQEPYDMTQRAPQSWKQSYDFTF